MALVDVELPALALCAGIRFVDTPGLGSVFAHNTRVSKDWMPRVGAALVAVSVNHPLSGDDRLLLNDVSAHTPEAAILITKADLVSGEELASVIAFTRSQAISRTGKEWRIPWEAEKNLSRVAAQWADAVGGAIDLLSRDAAAFIDRGLSTIEGIVDSREDPGHRGEEIRTALSELCALESAMR